MNKKLLRNLVGFLAACGLLGTAIADRVELSDGSVIHGKIVSLEAEKLKMETSFAGVIEIAQATVRVIATDEPINVSLVSGSAVLGQVSPANGRLKVAAANGELAIVPADIASVWRQGGESPAARLARLNAEKSARKWAYEASVALTGRTGASEKFNSAFGFKATLESAYDRLIFSLAAEQAEDNGVETANRQFGGVDYSSFYSSDNGWYVRTSLEADEIKGIDLRSLSAFGFSRKLVKHARHDLEGRIGASYLYESYSNNTTFSSPGLDVTLLNTYTFANAKLSSALTYTPAFKDFANYRVLHESSFELPLTAALWKLKLGLKNEYQSKPPAAIDKLDTTYFTSLILNWK
jgi:hypothetical protein